MTKEEDAMTEDDREHYGAIIQAIAAGVNTLHGKGAPGDMLATALMQVAVEIAVSSFGREDATTRLRAALDSLLKAEGPDETTH
jgi:hypothetical protein